ncbi:MAG: efflux RND transporter periplasmic adaptor subunit [Bacteroidota bacterium]
MTENNFSPEKKSRRKTVVVSLLILLAGAVVTTVIFLTEPGAEREGATRETAMLVNVITAERGNFQPVIIATGTVDPEQDVMLSPRVSGEILDISQLFTPGGFVKKGDVLVHIDPADYRIALQLRKSELHQAEAELAIEMGRQTVARKDYQLLDEDLLEENQALVLREPQLQTAQSRVEAAKAAVDRAQLDLQRTTLSAPFDAHILTRNVNAGSQVSPGENLGRLVGTEIYWITAAVPLAKINRLSFPDTDQSKGSEVRIRSRRAWADTVYRTGHLVKLIGALEDQTRMARVLIEVEDPLARKNPSGQKPPLMIGAFVEVHIMADTLKNVIRLSRDYLRKDETVWVMQDGKLRIRKVDVLFSDARYAYISGGIDENDKIVTTNLTTVTDGAALRTEANTSDARDVTTKSTGGMQ